MPVSTKHLATIILVSNHMPAAVVASVSVSQTLIKLLGEASGNQSISGRNMWPLQLCFGRPCSELLIWADLLVREGRIEKGS